MLLALSKQMLLELKVTAMSDDNVIMGSEHRILPIAVVQFHSESIMSLTGGVGLAIIKNVLHTYTKSINYPKLLQKGVA